MELWGTKLQVEQLLGSRNMWFWGEIKQTWLDSKEGLDFCLLTQNLPNDGKKVSNTKQKAYDVSMNGFSLIFTFGYYRVVIEVVKSDRLAFDKETAFQL